MKTIDKSQEELEKGLDIIMVDLSESYNNGDDIDEIINQIYQFINDNYVAKSEAKELVNKAVAKERMACKLECQMKHGNDIDIKSI